jgi:hypothetical protein
MARQPQWAWACSTRFLDHTQSIHTREDSSGRVIGSSQRPDNTQHSFDTHIHTAGGVRTRSASNRTTLDPSRSLQSARPLESAFKKVPLQTRARCIGYIIYYIHIYMCVCVCVYGPGSPVCIATGYGLDGPEIEFRWRRDFLHLSRPALGLTQPPVHWVPGLSGGYKTAGA